MQSRIDKEKLLRLIDFTSLNDDDSDTSIKAFCEKANTALGHVAAVCVYPEFVSTCRKLLSSTPVNVATVCNFPRGNQPLNAVVHAITAALKSGADEIDVVLPYDALKAGDQKTVAQHLNAFREATGTHILKVILETGALDNEHIALATSLACEAGADFVKTSTGKIPTGATEAAVSIMLKTLTAFPDVGIKISGGVRTIADAETFLHLIQSTKGVDWITPEHVRIGASRLLENIIGKK